METTNILVNAEESTHAKDAIKLLILAVFIDILGLTLLLPLLPFWSTHIGASEFTFGLLLVSYSIFQFIFAPIWGRLSDRIGRRPVIIVGLIGTVMSFLLLSVSALFYFTSIPLLFISRIVGGIFTSATLPTSQAYISDVSKDEETKTKYYGFIGAAVGVAFTLGPAMGGILAGVANAILPYNEGYWLPILLSLVLSSINLAYGYKRIPETLSLKEKSNAEAIQKRSIIQILTSTPVIVVMIVIFGGIYLAFSSLDSVLALYGNAKLGMNEIMIGLVFMGAGIVMIFTQGLFIGYLTKKLGNHLLIIIGSGLLAFSFYGISLATSFTDLMILVIPIAVGMSLVEPAGLALLTKATPNENQGEILGLNDSVGAFVRILGPLSATSLYSINIIYPWIFNTIVMILVIFVAILLYVKVNGSKMITTIRKGESHAL